MPTGAGAYEQLIFIPGPDEIMVMDVHSIASVKYDEDGVEGDGRREPHCPARLGADWPDLDVKWALIPPSWRTAFEPQPGGRTLMS